MKPELKNLTIVRFIEWTENVKLNIEHSPPYPYPHTVIWYKDNSTLVNDSRRILGYPTLRFGIMLRSYDGNYSITVTNYYVNDTFYPLTAFSTTSLSFTLEVLCELILLNFDGSYLLKIN